jgi:hypothetical protein
MNDSSIHLVSYFGAEIDPMVAAPLRAASRGRVGGIVDLHDLKTSCG